MGDIRERLQAMGYTPDDLDNLQYLSYPNLAKLDTERGARELVAAVSAKCEVVVIDTVSRSIEGDENENDTLAGVLSPHRARPREQRSPSSV